MDKIQQAHAFLNIAFESIETEDLAEGKAVLMEALLIYQRESKKPRILIEVFGGIIQSIVASQEIEYIVVDRDLDNGEWVSSIRNQDNILPIGGFCNAYAKVDSKEVTEIFEQLSNIQF
jgi:hypothetical protein